jgi:hypothetical protein
MKELAGLRGGFCRSVHRSQTSQAPSSMDDCWRIVIDRGGILAASLNHKARRKIVTAVHLSPPSELMDAPAISPDSSRIVFGCG